ncbi:carbamoyltransferase HypF [Thiocapsa roseopersicina]|uniref:Carbamoyltransferase HypF n=1 Tax=Thiocapsa roseopersicina TaxID=1058 RepID=A0A1H2S2G6_THIRO|nr:carbamoyltransferase HypF [Thiocapsa roseopersicina]SDW25801.1 Hydrogenase maturation protein, carbamoyltransferase HypF [Thiocapsa roseopersicina]
MTAESIRVRGLVQGVGFRPTVWRLARACGLRGDVRNDGEGVLIRVCGNIAGDDAGVNGFLTRLREECPPLARIDTIERCPIADPQALADLAHRQDFVILESAATAVHTGIVADAATCAACVAEIRDPADRRHRYPFTNCTHCGPRLSIVAGIPYDRARTSMAAFPMCPDCAAEYKDPADRRFHAQPNACPVCGPKVWLQDAAGCVLDPTALDAEDAIAAASRLLAEGRILAIKGIGGFHLACDATDPDAVAELRRRKRRYAKPLALMARDLDVIRGYCRVTGRDAALLSGPAAPILLLDRVGSRGAERDGERPRPLAPDVAPGQTTLGVMLPYSPIHHLLLADWDRPLVMTSGNLSEEPQCIDNADALGRLGQLADHLLLHDRAILNRVDDSVVRVMAGEARLLRRARGFAPTPLPLPPGFEAAPPLLALGGELKNTFCLVRDGQAILSQHLGDLEDAKTAREYERTLALYLDLFQVVPEALAVDLHPDYRSSLIGRDRAARDGLPLIGVQHHHAHLASTLADNGWPLDAGPVLGILLDGLGYGSDGTLWGGEFLLGDYLDFERVAHLKAVAMPGGIRAILEPWRNLYAHLESAGGWDAWRARFAGLEPIERLDGKPLEILGTLIARGLNAPLSSSTGRLFDAVAAALGVGGEVLTYEGQAAIALESLAAVAMDRVGEGYPFARLTGPAGELVLDPTPLWGALITDISRGCPPEEIAAAFHVGLATALSALALDLTSRCGISTVALSGGVFQNRLLLESVTRSFEVAGLRVLLQRQVPANDGGVSLGQAAAAAARVLRGISGA